MAVVHDIVMRFGREEAKRMYPADRALIDVAAAVLEEESSALGITYSGFCMTSLPHKRIPDDEKWERTAGGGRFSLLIEPGVLRVDRQLVRFGVPYGSRARLILLYLQTRAIQTNSREIELGRSLTNWIERMGIPIGGKQFHQVREQANRISACRLSFFYDDEHREGFEKDSIVKGGFHLKSTGDERQPGLWEDRVTLGETFFKALRKHPVPVWEPAIRQIANQSLTIDVYIWLAYRLHSLDKPVTITWTALFAQFGAGYSTVAQFKYRFVDAVRMALAVYQEARVEIEESRGGGLKLWPSRPPIPETKRLAR